MQRDSHRWLLPAFVFFLCLRGGLVLGQVTTATISGTVQDETGAVVPGASVTIRNTETGIARSLTSDAQGRYRATSLALGSYEVRVEMAGFQAAVRRGIELTIGREAVVDMGLKVGAVTEVVEVTGEAPLIDTVSGSIAGLVTGERIEALPLNGRDLTQLMTLEPGVTFVRRQVTGSAPGGDPTGGFGKRMSVAGSRPDMMGWSLDGTDINTYSKAGPGSAASVQMGVDSIREFQVLTNSYSAEYGGVGGGVINAVSKSGTNTFHGTAYEFLRNSAMDAANFFDNFSNLPKSPLRRNQFGASFGGPIAKDRAFFFSNYEGLRWRRTSSDSPIVPNAEARLGNLPGRARINVDPFVQTLLPLYPACTPGTDLGDGRCRAVTTLSEATAEDYLTGRVDYSFSPNEFLFGRYTFDNATDITPESFHVLSNGGRTRHQNVTVEQTSLLSAKWLNKVRAGFNRSLDSADFSALADIKPLMVTPLGYPAQFSVSGLGTLGLGTTIPRTFLLNHYELADDVGYSSGKHNAKFGVLIWHDRVYQNQQSRAGGQWTFTGGLAAFLAGNAASFNAPFAGTDAVRNGRQWLFGFYAQDSFNVLPRLTVNFGLRYEFVTEPTEINGKMAEFRYPTDPESTVGRLFINPSLKNFAPRLGFAWDPFGDGKTSVRGGFGIFYEELLRIAWGDIITRQPPFFFRGTLTAPFPVATAYAFMTTAGTVPTPDITSLQYDVNQPYVLQYNVNVQRQLSQTVVATLGYAGSHGVHMYRNVEGISANPTYVKGPDLTPCNPSSERTCQQYFLANATTLNPRIGSDRRKLTDAMSFYDALLVGIRKRFTGGLHIQSSWTWSKSMDEASALFAASLAGNYVAVDRLSHRRNRGLSLFDVRHNWVTNLLWELPWGKNLSPHASKLLGGWQLGTILTLQSGTPDTPQLGFNNSRNRSTRNLFDLPNVKAGYSNNPILNSRDVNNYFDRNAFELAPAGFYGNLGRNTLIGPGVATLDFSLFKSTSVPAISENFKVEFRAEFFNFFNRANFANPTVTEIVSTNNVPNPAAGQIRSTNTDARQIQLGLKLVW